MQEIMDTQCPQSYYDCMDDDTQTAQWWGLMVYVSAVGSAASAWAGRVSITFITCVGQL